MTRASRGARPVVSPGAAGWLLLASGSRFSCYATRELVLELRHDPDHLNLLVGLPAKR